MNETIEKIYNSKKKLIRLKFIIAAVFLLLIIAVMVIIVFTEEQKPDPASEKILRQLVSSQLKKAPDLLTDEDFAKITKIYISLMELSDIKLLEKFTNLKELYFQDIRFPDDKIPKWMKFLAKLEYQYWHLFLLTGNFGHS